MIHPSEACVCVCVNKKKINRERCHQTEHSSPQGPSSKAWPHRYIDMGEMGNMLPRAESEARRPHIHCAELIQAKQKT